MTKAKHATATLAFMKPVQRVLLIDDNPSCNFIMSEFIKLVDSEIAVFSTEGVDEGIDALEDDDQQFPDVIYVDINMPVLDGFAFLDKYEEKYFSQFPSTRVYMLSSSLRDEDRKRAMDYPSVNGFLSKDDIDQTLNSSLYQN